MRAIVALAVVIVALVFCPGGNDDLARSAPTYTTMATTFGAL